MKKLMILGGVAAMALLGAGLLVSLPAQAENDENSQLYPSGRFALVEGNINVASVQEGQINTQNVMLKIDSATGQVWVLQLCVNGKNDPTVRSAVWAPVLNQGSFNVGGSDLVANPNNY